MPDRFYVDELVGIVYERTGEAKDRLVCYAGTILSTRAYVAKLNEEYLASLAAEKNKEE